MLSSSLINAYIIVILLFIKNGDFAALSKENENSILNTDTSEEFTEWPDIAFKVSKCSSSEDDYESVPLCKSSIKKINPNDLIRERGYEIEDNSDFSQIIEVNVCDNPGIQCNDMFPFRKTACRQKHMKIQLKVSTRNNNTSSLEDFEIPSFCECTILRKIS